MTEQPMTAKTFAEGLRTASYFEVQAIVDAINVARQGHRKSFGGDDLMAAADYILTGKKPDDPPKSQAKAPAKPKT